MFKKIVSLLIITIIMSTMAMVAFAAPDIIYPDQESSAYWLFALKNPNVTYTTTLKTAYTISGTSPEGTLVSLYKYNPYDGVYWKMYMYGESLESWIGGSGLYLQQVDLNEGDNRYMIRAQRDGEVQFVKFNINYLGQDFLDNLRGMSTDAFGDGE